MENESKRKMKERFSLRRDIFKEFLAEFLGIFVLILFGCGSVAQTVLSKGALGEPLTIHVGFTLGVMMAVYMAGGVSGAHVNPAVSLAMVILGKLPLKKFPVYVVAQFLGAFVGSCAVYGLYYDALMEYTNGEFAVTGVNATANIFASYPAKHLSVLNGFVDQMIDANDTANIFQQDSVFMEATRAYRDACERAFSAVMDINGHMGLHGKPALYRLKSGERGRPLISLDNNITKGRGHHCRRVIATGALILCILAITDRKNIGAPKGMEPLCIGLIIMAIGVSMGLNCGYPINPARDLGPRFFTAVAGWGMDVFRAGGCWWWIPVAGPMVGGAVGAGIYFLFIELHHPEPEKQEENNVQDKYEMITMS